MMPKRLSESGSDATDLERLLLASRSEPKPSERERVLVWQRLLCAFPLPADSPPSTAPEAPAPRPSDAPAAELLAAAVPAVRWAPLLLSGGIGLVLGVVATAGFFLLRGAPSSPAAAASGAGLAPAAASMALSEASGEPALDTPTRNEPQRPALPRPSPEQSHRVSPNNRGVSQRAAAEPAPLEVTEPLSEVVEPAASARVANRLHEEAMLLRQAREELGRGALAEASSTLSRSRVLFPDSLLLQEREAFTIELLFRQGHRSEASSLAKVFLSKYPHSPHAVQVRRALESQR